MTKMHDTLSEVPRTAKHQFRKAEHIPGKAQRHRYERRKIKEVLRLGCCQGEDGA
jgi:hypothetical protein